MKTFLPALFAAVALVATGLADSVKMPQEVREALKAPEKFHDIRKVADLPPDVLKLTPHGGTGMANPGEEWQVTDVVRDRTLPGRRLIWAASNGAYCVIHYETGGIAHIFHTAVIGLEHGKTEAHVVWEYTGTPAK